MQYRIERLQPKRHDRSTFCCGVTPLDVYLARQAGQDMSRRVSTCYVAVDDEGNIAGYYTIAQAAALLDALPQTLQKRLPRYPLVPGTLIGRLAVSVHHQGRGLGGALLFDALRRAWAVAQEVSAVVVLVAPKNPTAQAFYAHYGFELTQNNMMYLPVATIEKLLPAGASMIQEPSSGAL